MSKPIPNKYPGTCTECAQPVEPGEGQAIKSDITGRWLVRHRPARWVHPTGPWDKFESYQADGCPPWTKE